MVVCGMPVVAAIAPTATGMPPEMLRAPPLPQQSLPIAAEPAAVPGGTESLVVQPPLSSQASGLSTPRKVETASSEVEQTGIILSRRIEPGETLDAILAEAGLSAPVRAEAALALGAEYDLRRLRPGHEVEVAIALDGTLERLALSVDEGVTIEAFFGETTATRVVQPEAETVTRAGEVRIESSVYAALDTAGIPARFAVDLAQMLGHTVDLRRELNGGETLRLLWREARVGKNIIGQPQLAFAALDLEDELYEVVWPDDGSGRATIYRDGEVLHVFAQPVEGARLSSVFGRRTHPIYGNVRMHTGVDFAAPQGTPVYATAPGSIGYIGWRDGYGRIVEITHGSDTVTRYAHLSAVPDGLAEGQRVDTGRLIGNVGATGTATGSNLHYEVLVDGRPTNPLSNDQIANVAETDTQNGIEQARLRAARALLESRLTQGDGHTPHERS
ncbi:MAG: M23 family metallopeptidase [Alphaproteobacteria bacterium]|nr:M23 family metallopeptidase [Alphaproteobacteria bacterium]MBU0797597.1 M23 family metallopeptidase [Alphaproteobacteria bacterium]MBU0886615.1 M23 family metallopeptidase [Alphaproteobacteria bacterium]MBU1812588.1 M23 family metallopeptidase [Alphaproteobacteria bacterium]